MLQQSFTGPIAKGLALIALVIGGLTFAFGEGGAKRTFAGIVFALDGVLLGAGDAAFMRTATVVCALVGFLPLIWLSLAYGWGLAGIWSGLSMFVALRLIFVGWRAISGRWAVTGTA